LDPIDPALLLAVALDIAVSLRSSTSPHSIRFHDRLPWVWTGKSNAGWALLRAIRRQQLNRKERGGGRVEQNRPTYRRSRRRSH